MIKHALKARKFFPLAPRKQAARQAVAYMRAVEYLGDKWLLSKQSSKLATMRPV